MHLKKEISNNFFLIKNNFVNFNVIFINNEFYKKNQEVLIECYYF